MSFTVTNTGARSGNAVPQVYLGAPDRRPSGVQFADKALASFDRVSLRPGQSTKVTLTVAQRELSYWSATANKMAARDRETHGLRGQLRTRPTVEHLDRDPLTKVPRSGQPARSAGVGQQKTPWSQGVFEARPKGFEPLTF
ncbi:fibronectin type III-like domain-contianing protein [Amycolatopsis acidicola]|uniref:fibronectin type III-like domain-contianing protein n=1 Tax=Amycolatopsis acidicola TaxID=2596893 RepID=UPI001AA08BBF|nr:fibronectin type III-like domain-contianing protein [Amycolatopsis acidicola]